MYGHGCKLKRLLRSAVEAYLDEPTCALAARRAGIARSTLFRWLPLPEFRRMHDQVLAERYQLGRAAPAAMAGSPRPQGGCSAGSVGVGPAAARLAA